MDTNGSLGRRQLDLYILSWSSLVQSKNSVHGLDRFTSKLSFGYFRERFDKICKGEIKVPMLTIMRDVAIAKTEFVPGQKAVTKIQNFQLDDELFSYCQLPEVTCT